MKVEVNGNTYINPTNLPWKDHKTITVNVVIQALYNISLGLDPYKHLKLPVEPRSFTKEYRRIIEMEVKKFLYQHICHKDKNILLDQSQFIAHIVGATTLVLSELINDKGVCESLYTAAHAATYDLFALTILDSISNAVDLTKKTWDKLQWI